MISMGRLSSAMRRIGGLVEQNTIKKTKITAETTIRTLVETTPVDTTEAVSNWQLTINQPATDVIPPYTPGKKGSSAVSSRLITNTVALRVLQDYKRTDQTILITNPTPYIDELNKGRSNQAPPGFIEEAIEEGKRASSVLSLLRRGLF